MNFLGIGAPSKATGLTCTSAYVKILQLELALHEPDQQNPMASVDLKTSKRLPIMTKAKFDEWKKVECKKESGERRVKLEEIMTNLSVDLYGESGDKGIDSKGIPLGQRALWGIMSKRRNELFGPSYKEIFQSEEGVGDILGQGAFSLVAAVKGNKSYVLKLPTLYSQDYVSNEKDILQTLKSNDTPQISSLVETRRLNLHVGQMDPQPTVEGLVLSPRGIPVDVYVGTFDDPTQLENFVFGCVFNGIKGALQFIHGRGIIHCDNHPGNWIVVEVNGTLLVYLVDFGSAYDKSSKKKVTGFRGNPETARDDVFWKHPTKSWVPTAIHDNAGLSFSSCLLLPWASEKWDMGKFPAAVSKNEDKDELIQALNSRSNLARQILDQYKDGEYAEASKELKAWLPSPNPSMQP